MIHLINGSKEIRVKSSEGVTVLKCGCASTDVMHLQMCDEHYQDWRARHEAAKIAHAATLAGGMP